MELTFKILRRCEKELLSITAMNVELLLLTNGDSTK